LLEAISSKQPGFRFRDCRLQYVHVSFYSSDVLEKVEAMDVSKEEGEELLKTASWHVQRWVGGAGVTPSVSDAANVTDVDARPSTSGGINTRPKICDGSDLDSEFDDEFDVDPVETIARDVPDDEELEAPVRDIINDIEKGMDRRSSAWLIEQFYMGPRLLDSFRGTPEVFSGPTLGPIKDYDSPYDAFTDIWDKQIIELSSLKQTDMLSRQSKIWRRKGN
jgi:hypothetical protein